MPLVNIPEMPKVGKIDALEMQVYWHRVFSDPRYRRNLMKRIFKGEAAHMEILLHHMTYGKPKETLALQQPGDGTLILQIGGKTVVELHADGDGFAKVLPAETETAAEATAETDAA